MIDWFAILPHMSLAGGGLILFCVGAFWPSKAKALLFPIALIAIVLTGVASALIPPQAPQFLGMLEVQGYGRFLTILIAGITLLSLLFCHPYAKLREIAGDELYGLLLFATLGMILVAGALHWLTFFLGIETLSLSLYVLIAIRKGDPGSNEAAVKYFIVGAVAGAFLTFGIAIIYAVAGTLNIAKSLSVGTPAGSTSLIFLGLSLILVGLGFKISMVPFHLWTPDVYQGAPAPITAFLSTGSKVALFAALLRFASYSSNEIWLYLTPPLWILAVLTMGVGTISALAQFQVKRLLAYSSIAQMGYLLMTLLAVKQNGATAILFYLTVYALMDLGAFGTLALLSAEKTDLDLLSDLQGLAYTRPWRSAILGVSLVSLAGLPPTAGFIGKFALFWAVLQGRYLVIALIGIMAVILSIYFYFKVVVALFMRPAERAVPVPALSLGDRLAGGLILLLILLLGLFPGPLFMWIEQAMF
jgi:NADH-quinone oxidoreductase subunit N